MGADDVKRDRLSIMLRSKCDKLGMTFEEASLQMGEPANAVSRWVSLSVLPGPSKYQAIADFLGVSIYDVGGALALDQVARWEKGLSQ